MESKKVSVKYCDSESRHRNGGTNCCYVSPEISRLVDSRHKRSHSLCGINYNHFSFHAVRDASIKARLNKRFESLDNDRDEHMIDFLNAIDDKQANACGVLQKIESLIERDGLSSSLLKTIGDAFKPFGVISVMGRNTTAIANDMQTINESYIAVKKSNDAKHSKMVELLRNAFDKLSANQKNNLECVKQIDKIGVETNGKLETLIGLFGEHLKSVRDDKQEVNEMRSNYQKLAEIMPKVADKVIDIEKDAILSNARLARISSDVDFLGNVFDNHSSAAEKELQEVRQELANIKDEMITIRKAIVDVLPEKLIQALKKINDNEDALSTTESDIEFVDARQLNV